MSARLNELGPVLVMAVPLVGPSCGKLISVPGASRVMAVATLSTGQASFRCSFEARILRERAL